MGNPGKKNVRGLICNLICADILALQPPLTLGARACMTKIIQSWPPNSRGTPGIRSRPTPGSGLPPTTVAKTMTAATTAARPAAAASQWSTRKEAGDVVAQACQLEGLGPAVWSVHLLPSHHRWAATP